MNSVRKAALLTRLIDKLREKGSWTEETHIQKAAYFAKILAGVDMDHEYVLYKFGPFSFDLGADLTALRADGLATLEVVDPYGPRVATTGRAARIQRRFPKTLEKYDAGLEFAAANVGDQGVAALERVGTALFLLRKREGAEDIEIVRRITELKPRIPVGKALDGVAAARDLEAAARKAFPS